MKVSVGGMTFPGRGGVRLFGKNRGFGRIYCSIKTKSDIIASVVQRMREG